MSNNGPYPETRPKRNPIDVKEEIAKGDALTKPATESFVQAQIRARREAEAKNAGMTIEQVEALEREKAEYIAAATLPPKVKGTVESTLLAPKPKLDAAAVAARLAAAEDELRAAQDEVAAAEREAKRQEEARGFVIEKARQKLGAVQSEQVALTKQQTEADLLDRARRLQESEVANKSVMSTEAEAQYNQFSNAAIPLVAKLEQLAAELAAFSKKNGPALSILGATDWSKTPATWPTSFRQEYAGKASQPAQEIVGSVARILASTQELVAQARQVIAGRAEPHEHLLSRMQQASKNGVAHFESLLGVLNTKLKMVEQEAQRRVVPGVIPTVRIREKNPARDTSRPQATVITGWNPDAK